MGLFSFMKKMSQGTFGLIPRNWAYVYLRLNQFHGDRFAQPEAALSAAAVINAADYVVRGQIQSADLDKCYHNAKLGLCGPVPCMQTQAAFCGPVNHGFPGRFTESGEAEYELILNYAVQYTAILLSIDSPSRPAGQIIEACVHQKPVIADSLATLNEELQRGTGNSYKWNHSVEGAMSLAPSNALTPFLRWYVTN